MQQVMKHAGQILVYLSHKIVLEQIKEETGLTPGELDILLVLATTEEQHEAKEVGPLIQSYMGYIPGSEFIRKRVYSLVSLGYIAEQKQGFLQNRGIKKQPSLYSITNKGLYTVRHFSRLLKEHCEKLKDLRTKWERDKLF
jgi:hypothetical protein